jgi:hypothetical protein
MIKPLAITQPDWKTFIQMCQKHLGFSPTRGLDESILEIKDSAAFLSCLNLDNKPIENLRCNNPSWSHVMISFIATMKSETLMRLYEHATVDIIPRQNKKGDVIAIMSGTIDKWYDSIIFCCRDDKLYDGDVVESFYDIRAFMTEIIKYFERTGFREILHHLVVVKCQDGTYSVGRRID